MATVRAVSLCAVSEDSHLPRESVREHRENGKRERRTAGRPVPCLFRHATAQTEHEKPTEFRIQFRTQPDRTLRPDSGQDLHAGARHMFHHGGARQTRDFRLAVRTQGGVPPAVQLHCPDVRGPHDSRQLFVPRGQGGVRGDSAFRTPPEKLHEELLPGGLCAQTRPERLFHEHRPVGAPRSADAGTRRELAQGVGKRQKVVRQARQRG